MSRKWRYIAGLLIGMLLLCSQFQNCAPAPSSPAPTGASPELRVIEDWTTEKVQILAHVLEVPASRDRLSVDGFCARNFPVGEILNWEVRDPAIEAAILSGQVGCERGGFRVELSELSELECGRAYNVEVQTSGGEGDQAILIRRCAL